MTAIEPDDGERKAMSEETTMRDGEERDREEKWERETERASTEHASPKDGGGAPGSAAKLAGHFDVSVPGPSWPTPKPYPG